MEPGMERGSQTMRFAAIFEAKRADVAQLVEQLIRNQQVTGSNPVVGSILMPPRSLSRP